MEKIFECEAKVDNLDEATAFVETELEADDAAHSSFRRDMC